MTNEATEERIEAGLARLNELAIEEYGRDLADIAASVQAEKVFSPLPFGRLLGILIKEPFSEVTINPDAMGPKRHWELVPARVVSSSSQNTWQFRVIEELQVESKNYEFEKYDSVASMVAEVHRETGFFWHLLRSVRKGVCNDPRFAAALKEKMGQLRGSGSPVTLPTASVAAAIGAFLAAQIPTLGAASAPVIAGAVILLWQIGTDAFCSWSAQIINGRVWSTDS